MKLDNLVAAADAYIDARTGKKTLATPAMPRRQAINAYLDAIGPAGVDRVFAVLKDFASADVKNLRKALLDAYPGLEIDPE